MTTKPKPIRDDPTQGQWQIVASFRVAPKPGITLDGSWQEIVGATLLQGVGCIAELADLDVAVRVIGAGGERSEMEDEWPPQGTRTGLGRPEGVG